ncbi:hypothetical protein [Glycomyces tarimensis]
MVSVETQRIRDLGDAVRGPVLATLEEANEILPKLREIDQDLYTSVHPTLAIAYTAGTSYMYSMVQGAAECFAGMSEALTAAADGWDGADEETAKSFQ